MDLSGLFTYVATLSVATERVTEFLKRVPGVSNYLSKPKDGAKENWRVMAVYGLSTLIGMLLCHWLPALFPKFGQSVGTDPSWGLCFVYGLLASGGSSFWNSALDTFRGVKKQMGG